MGRGSAIIFHHHKYEFEKRDLPEWISKPDWMSDASDPLETVWGWSSMYEDKRRFGFETKEEAKQDALEEGFAVS